MKNSHYYITSLGLQKHPEGGYYKEVYRSSEEIDAVALPPRFGGNRCLGTSIYYLLENADKSHFHRIKSDETWHFYEGRSVTLYILHTEGALQRVVLGKNTGAGELFQFTVPAGLWFAAALAEKENSFALMGCTVAPGFDFADFEMGDRAILTALYPEHSAVIQEFTL